MADTETELMAEYFSRLIRAGDDLSIAAEQLYDMLATLPLKTGWQLYVGRLEGARNVYDEIRKLKPAGDKHGD